MAMNVERQAVMSIPIHCTRHGPSTWMAYCSACTAWHLALEIARRDASVPARAPSTRRHR
jgi:hypothetical protein